MTHFFKAYCLLTTALVFLFIGCDGGTSTNEDLDGDGFSRVGGVDCNDDDATVFPGADEVPYDRVDQNCSGSDLTDVDNDGYPGGPDGTDCHDTRSDVHPAGVDVCGDGIDQDCSGADQNCSDVDGDGDGFSPNEGDCNDANANVNPGSAETPYNGKDDDCDLATLDDDLDGDGFFRIGGGDCNDEDATQYPGADDGADRGGGQICAGTGLTDVDLDGYAGGLDGTACNDTRSDVNPGEIDVCGDGIDQDCSGNEQGCTGGEGDSDGDGFTVLAGDCNDSDATVNPGYEEISYNGKDDDCDPATADDDLDGDGFFMNGGGDCNDEDPAVFPGAEEVPNDGVDQDCSGSDLTDLDLDGYPGGLDGTDCNDNNPRVHPGAVEICGDSIDNDCDGSDDVCNLSGFIYLNRADSKFIGEAAGDGAGGSVSSAGDVNGDGFDDLLIGAGGNDSGGDMAGAAYLVYGPVSGTVDLSAADAKFIGEAEFDSARVVSGAGDVNGDGCDDILIGADRNDSGGDEAGAAYLVYGPVSGTLDLVDADATFVGEAVDDRAGCSVSSAGDVNGDGFGDLLIGASQNYRGGREAGAAYLFYGPVIGTHDLSTADAELIGEAAGDHAGTSVSSAWDVNSDGFDDILIGARRNDSGGDGAGAAYVVYGK